MPQTCPQCQSQAADDANHCPSCGAALSRPRPPPRRSRGRTAPRRTGASAPAAAAPARGVRLRGAGLQVRRGPLDAGRPDRRGRHHRAVHLLFLPWFGITVGSGMRVTANGSVATGGCTSH